MEIVGEKANHHLTSARVESLKMLCDVVSWDNYHICPLSCLPPATHYTSHTTTSGAFFAPIYSLPLFPSARIYELNYDPINSISCSYSPRDMSLQARASTEVSSYGTSTRAKRQIVFSSQAVKRWEIAHFHRMANTSQRQTMRVFVAFLVRTRYWSAPSRVRTRSHCWRSHSPKTRTFCSQLVHWATSECSICETLRMKTSSLTWWSTVLTISAVMVPTFAGLPSQIVSIIFELFMVHRAH